MDRSRKAKHKHGKRCARAFSGSEQNGTSFQGSKAFHLWLKDQIRHESVQEQADRNGEELQGVPPYSASDSVWSACDAVDHGFPLFHPLMYVFYHYPVQWFHSSFVLYSEDFRKSGKPPVNNGRTGTVFCPQEEKTRQLLHCLITFISSE